MSKVMLKVELLYSGFDEGFNDLIESPEFFGDACGSGYAFGGGVRDMDWEFEYSELPRLIEVCNRIGKMAYLPRYKRMWYRYVRPMDLPQGKPDILLLVIRKRFDEDPTDAVPHNQDFEEYHKQYNIAFAMGVEVAKQYEGDGLAWVFSQCEYNQERDFESLLPDFHMNDPIEWLNDRIKMGSLKVRVWFQACMRAIEYN